MKTISYISSLILSISLWVFTGCSDMNDTQREFIEMGSRIYAGKIDSLVVHGGDHRVQITGLMHYAYTAESCIIKWENDSVIVPLKSYAIGDTFKVIISGLEEGSRRFFVQTCDKDGNRSLKETCMGYSYGEEYILQATPKFISQMSAEPSGIVLIWNVSEDAEGVELIYESNEGEKTLLLSGDVKETRIADWKLGGYLKTRTRLLPERDAIDMFYTDWLTQRFPEFVEFTIDKTKITPLKLSKDATTGYSGRIEGVFDGTIAAGGAQFHSGDGVGVPQHLTFDLGVQTSLTRLEIWARSDGYNNWNPKKIQIWGIADITGAEIALPSMDADWETEAEAKGWIKLMDGVCNEPVNNRLSFDDTTSKIRYIIIRTTEVYGGPSSGSGAYVIIQEINLYANYIAEFE